MKYHQSSEKGQVIVPILGLMVILLIALSLVVDFSRWMLLRSRVRTIADSAALSGAGGLDMRQSAQGAFQVNPVWAKDRALNVYQQSISLNPKDAWMSIQIMDVAVHGRTVTVTVTGSCPTVFAGALGIGSFSTSVTSSARAAVGITQER